MRWLPCGIVLITGCASVLGTKQADFSFNSSPQQAQVFVDGSAMGETPLKTKLSNTKAHTVTFKKDGFQDISCQLERSTGAGWVIFDVLTGLVPVIIDAATGNWSQTNAHECTETLRPLDAGRADVVVNDPNAARPYANVTSAPATPAAAPEPTSPVPPAKADASVPTSRLGPRTTIPRDAPVPAQSERSSRLRAELLQDKEFRVAFDDVRRLGVAIDFDEVEFGLLRVTIGPGFTTVSSAGYNLEHLYSVYRTTSYRRADAVIELWRDGAKIGEVTSGGVLVGPEFRGAR
jgi:hypothetical protein